MPLNTSELVTLITQGVVNSAPALVVIIAFGAGIKIVFDLIFSALYNVTSRH